MSSARIILWRRSLNSSRSSSNRDYPRNPWDYPRDPREDPRDPREDPRGTTWTGHTDSEDEHEAVKLRDSIHDSECVCQSTELRGVNCLAETWGTIQ